MFVNFLWVSPTPDEDEESDALVEEWPAMAPRETWSSNSSEHSRKVPLSGAQQLGEIY